MFYSLNDEFVNGWKYDGGNITAKIEAEEIEPSAEEGETKSSSLRSASQYISIQICWYSIASGDGGVTWSAPKLMYCRMEIFLLSMKTYIDSGGGYTPIGGGGGGGGSAPTEITIAPYAKKIFRNLDIDDSKWQDIEDMLLKIMKNCLGKALYNGLAAALNGQTLAIQFNESENTSSFNPVTGTISLDKTGESNRLFHEIWHAYQFHKKTNEAAYTNSKLNREMEAWYAQYLYVKSLPEYAALTGKWSVYNDTDLGNGIRLMEKHVNHKGNLLSDETELYNHLAGIEMLFREIPEYSKEYYPYDYDMNPISNFINLKNLSHNCD